MSFIPQVSLARACVEGSNAHFTCASVATGQLRLYIQRLLPVFAGG